jgi:hypothetical protein
LDDAAATQVNEWLTTNAVRVLNVAGPRESSQRGIAQAATSFLTALLGRGQFARRRVTTKPARTRVSRA